MRLDGAHRLLDAARLAGDLEQRLELRAHARAEELVVVHDQDARLAHWRSSSTSSTSVPPPGALVTRARPPWRSMRPTIDSRTPRRSPGTALGSKPGPAVAHEHLRAAGAALGVDVHGRAAAELRRVRHRLAGGGDDRLVSAVEVAVAHHHHLDRHPVALLDVRGGGLERGGEPSGLARRRPPGQPGAQLALLAAGDGGDLARVAGAALDHRERLEDGVVQVRGYLGALLRADPLGALLVSERTSRTTQGAKITPSTTTAATSASSTSRAAPSAPVAWRKTKPAAITSAMPMPGPRDGGGRAAALGHGGPLRQRCGGLAARAGCPDRRRAGWGLAPGVRPAERLPPHQRAAARDQHERPHDRVGEPDSERAEGEQRRHQQQPGSERHLDGRAAGGQPAAGRAGLARGDQDPRRASRRRRPKPPAAVATTKARRTSETSMP